MSEAETLLAKLLLGCVNDAMAHGWLDEMDECSPMAKALAYFQAKGMYLSATCPASFTLDPEMERSRVIARNKAEGHAWDHVIKG